MPFKRGNQWHITVNGVRQSAKTAVWKDAHELEKKLNAEHWQKKHLGIRFADWDQACLDWFTGKEGKLKSIGTQTYWGTFWEPHLAGDDEAKPKRKPKLLTQISGTMIRDILKARPGVNERVATRQNNTANQYAAFVAKIMKHARAPFEFDPFPETAGRDEWLTVDQWKDLEAVMPTELRQIATFSLATGLRKSNVIGLQWDWIKGNSLIIPAAFTKTAKPYGLPLNKTALGIIEERKAARRNDAVVSARNVFALGGQEVQIVPLHRAWKRALKTSGVPDMPYHGLRHTYASWMVQAEVPHEIVAKFCQWSLKGMVHRYAHFDVERLRVWAERFDAILCTNSAQSHKENGQVSEDANKVA